MNTTRISLTVNAILAIAVAVLYYLHFSASQGSIGYKGGEEGSRNALSTVFFVNIDSLNSNLSFLTERQEELEKKEIDADVALKKKGAELEKEFLEYQKQAQSGYLTPKQMQAIEQRLTRKQQAIMAERDSVMAELLKEGQEINKMIADKLKVHLSEFASGRACDLVIGYTEGGNILHFNKDMDITDLILKKMNKE